MRAGQSAGVRGTPWRLEILLAARRPRGARTADGNRHQGVNPAGARCGPPTSIAFLDHGHDAINKQQVGE